jgi:hypothetical protein
MGLGDDLGPETEINKVIERLADAWRAGDGTARADEPDAVPVAVLERHESGWKVVTFQYTPFVVNEFRENGYLKRFKCLAAEQNAEP